MSGWPTPKGPLDWVARSKENELEVCGEPKPGMSDASDWFDPTRPAVMLPMFRTRLDGCSFQRIERYVIVDGRGYLFPTKFNDADYITTSQDQSPQTAGTTDRLIEDAKRFALRRREGTEVQPCELKSFFEACLSTLEVEYSSENSSPNRITLMRLALQPLVRPRFAPCLPLPSDQLEWRCTRSGATWQAMLSLAKVFGGTRPPIALVTGPPGSGKNAYARAVHFGQRRTAAIDTRYQKDSLETLPLVGFDPEMLKARLRDCLEIRQKSRCGGTLFLDEVDKATPELRSSLLRILENREYEGRFGVTEKCDNVAMVIAAGKPLGALRGEDPPDFWTRIEVHIPVADPLTAGSQIEREDLLQAFFKFFWWDAVSEWLAGLLSKPNDDEWDDFFTKNSRAKELARGVFDSSIGVFKKGLQGFTFERCGHIEEIASEFASVLSPHLERRQLSLRGLRSAVGAVQRGTTSHLIAMALSGQRKTALEEFMKKAKREVHSAIGTVLQVLPEEYESRASRKAERVSTSQPPSR